MSNFPEWETDTTARKTNSEFSAGSVPDGSGGQRGGIWRWLINAINRSPLSPELLSSASLLGEITPIMGKREEVKMPESRISNIRRGHEER